MKNNIWEVIRVSVTSWIKLTVGFTWAGIEVVSEVENSLGHLSNLRTDLGPYSLSASWELQFGWKFVETNC